MDLVILIQVIMNILVYAYQKNTIYRNYKQLSFIIKILELKILFQQIVLYYVIQQQQILYLQKKI